MIRNMSVAGSFYPQRDRDLLRYFEHFSKVYDEHFSLPDIKTKAVIVPHAGYVYSGYTANIAYRLLQNNDIKTLVVIGPSHKVRFRGISLCEAKSYDTPFGEIQSADEMVQEFKDKFALKTLIKHNEHSTEVQFPFIKHYMKDVNIVELIYGDADTKNLSEIIDFVLEQKDCGVVISTDLSHFHNLESANKIDNICLNAIENLSIETLQNGCEACGKKGVHAMLLSAKKLKLTSKLLDYRTSADISKDTTRVVGYVSACFSQAI